MDIKSGQIMRIMIKWIENLEEMIQRISFKKRQTARFMKQKYNVDNNQ